MVIVVEEEMPDRNFFAQVLARDHWPISKRAYASRQSASRMHDVWILAMASFTPCRVEEMKVLTKLIFSPPRALFDMM